MDRFLILGLLVASVSAQAPAGIWACLARCPNGNRLIPPGLCRLTADQCYLAISTTARQEICGDYSATLIEEYVFFDSSATVENCTTFVEQVLAPFIPSSSSSQLATTTERNDNACGCTTVLDSMFSLAIDVPRDANGFCSAVLGLIFNQLEKRICKGPTKILGKLGKFLCSFATAALTTVQKIVEVGWQPVCNLAVEFVKELGLDLDQFLDEYHEKKDSVLSLACGALTCAKPASGCAVAQLGLTSVVKATLDGACFLLGNGEMACTTSTHSFIIGAGVAALVIH